MTSGRSFSAADRARLRADEPFLAAARRFAEFKRDMCLLAAPAGTDWDKARRHLDHAARAYLRAFAEDALKIPE